MERLPEAVKIVTLLAYNGCRYRGFQWQPNGPTVQSQLETALRKINGEERRVIGASRTDSGVHARGQVVSFFSRANLKAKNWVNALNYYLPEDIVVYSSYRLADDFNIRKNAVSREYDYYILNSEHRSVFYGGLALQVRKPLDVKVMNEACRYLIGTLDLASFAGFGGGERDTVKTVYDAWVRRKGNLVVFHISANSFLIHQVRNTVGLLLKLGTGKIGISDFIEIRDARKKGLAGPTAPARGLCLSRINYQKPFEEIEVLN